MKEESDRNYQLKQQEFVFNERKQTEDARLKNEKIKGDFVKSFFSFLKSLK
jgi:hypothetical protein